MGSEYTGVPFAITAPLKGFFSVVLSSRWQLFVVDCACTFSLSHTPVCVRAHPHMDVPNWHFNFLNGKEVHVASPLNSP